MQEGLPTGLRPGGRFDEWRRRPISYVVIDMDGTLIGRGDEVPAGARRAVTDTMGRGISVGFASGRVRHGVLHVQRELAIPGPHVFCDGAEVRADGRTIDSWPLARSAVEAIVELSDRTGTYCELYTPDHYFITRYRRGAERHWDILRHEPAGELGPTDLDETFLKATFIGFDQSETEAIESGAREIGLEVGAAGTPDLAWDFINIKAEGVDKGRAVASAADHLDVTMETVMAVGDGGNDVPMLAAVGTAVAMGQASERVREAAHLVTAAVDEDGLATALDGLTV